MPGGDRTGPMGKKARTGRAAGYCAGSGEPGYANPVPASDIGMDFARGRGPRGRGFGGNGRGWRNMFRATGLPRWMRSGGNAAPYGYPAPYQKPDPEMEEQELKNQVEALQSELDSIRKQLDEIKTKTTSE